MGNTQSSVEQKKAEPGNDEWEKLDEIDDETRQVLLMGLAGEGKSSTGNAMLGRYADEKGKSSTGNAMLGRHEGLRAFKQGGGWNPITESSYVSSAMIDNVRFDVTDMPGYNDKKLTSLSERRENVATAIAKSLLTCPYGFHAILLVIGFTHRLSEDGIRFIRELIHIIGPEAFRKKGIVVVTHGSDWEGECNIENPFAFTSEPERYEEYKKNVFMDWAKREQRSTIHGDIFSLFEDRWVLFENKQTDLSKRNVQMKTLVQEIKALGTLRYIPEVCKHKGRRIQEYLNDHNIIIELQTFSMLVSLVLNAIVTQKREIWIPILDEHLDFFRHKKLELTNPIYMRYCNSFKKCVENFEKIKELSSNPEETFLVQCINIHDAQIDVYKALEKTYYFEAIKLNATQGLVNFFPKRFGKRVY